MKIEKKLIAYTKILGIYEKADDFFLTIFKRNQYEKHVTEWGIESAFFIFGYDIAKFDEIMTQNLQDKKIPRKVIIASLKHCINELNKKL